MIESAASSTLANDLSNEELLSRLVSLVESERRATQSVLVYLVQIETRRVYAAHGYSSMFEYLTKGLGYSDSSAHRRIRAARVLMHVPEIGAKLEDGSINLSQLAEIEYGMKRSQRHANERPADVIHDLINKVEGHSIFETRKILAREFDLPVRTDEIIRPQQDSSVRIEMTFSEDQMRTLQKARELLSHSLPYASWAELFTFLAEGQTAKLEKSRRTKPGEDPNEGGASSAPASVASVTRGLTDETVANDAPIAETPCSASRFNYRSNYRSGIPARLKRAVYSRAHHRCEYVDPISQRSCESAFFLEIDHIRPLAHGGDHTFENLRVYCRTHNLLAAMQLGLIRPFRGREYPAPSHLIN